MERQPIADAGARPAEPKPADRLKRDDLQRHPLWEWIDESLCRDGMDESYVTPVPGDAIPLGGFRQFLCAAETTLKDGTTMPACVEVTIQGQRVRCMPLFLLLGDRQLGFESTETERLLSRYTKKLNNRPVKWTLQVRVEGERKPRGGRVRRSLYYVLGSLLVSWGERKLRKSNRS